MKRLLSLFYRFCLALFLCAALLACTVQAAPGLTRVPARQTGYMQAEDLVKQYGIKLTDGLPLYAPKSPQPMNAYMVTHPECEVGINQDGMYKVSEKGLVRSITKYLKEWMGAIEKESQGAIRFVESPGNADILIVAKQSYFFHGNYRGGGRVSKGYGCRISLEAHRLTVSGQNAVLNMKRTPGQRETISGGSEFWKFPPEISETRELQQFVRKILGWYGYGAQQDGKGVKAVQQALISRGLLEGAASGTFDTQTVKAIKQLQDMKGLEVTGKVDIETLTALYYDE